MKLNIVTQMAGSICYNDLTKPTIYDGQFEVSGSTKQNLILRF